MIKLCFMRWCGKRKPFSYIADMPLQMHQKNIYVDPFIVVQIDEKEVPTELLGNQTVRLDLPSLQSKYPDSTERYIDEDGKEQERIIYGYFSEHGRSVDDNPPVITMGDVLYE